MIFEKIFNLLYTSLYLAYHNIDNKENLDFIKKVIAPYSVNTFLRMSVMKTKKSNIITLEVYQKIKNECRKKIQRKTDYPEKTLQKAFYFVSQLTEEKL